MVLATSSKFEVSGSVVVTGSIDTKNLIVQNTFTLNGSLDLGTF
jgi:cytoskeletal protein CcmA (bactofilin family)